MAQIPPAPWLAEWQAKQAAEAAEAKAREEAVRAALPEATPGAVAAAAERWRNGGKAKHEALAPPHQRRGENGHFLPGMSANPAGRVKGSRNRAAVLAQALDMDGNYEAIVAALVTKAKAGDTQAANIILARTQPPGRPTPQTVRFTLDTTKPIAEQSAQVMQAVAEGQIAPEQAQLVFQCLSAHVSIKQAEEIEARLRALEGKGTKPVLGSGSGVVLEMVK